MAVSMTSGVTGALTQSRRRYREGRPIGPLEHLERASITGTRIAFAPDPSIFVTGEVSRSLVRERLRTVATLRPGLALMLNDLGPPEVFRLPGGAVDYVGWLKQNAQALHDNVFHLRGQANHIDLARRAA